MTITPRQAEYARAWVAGVPQKEIARRFGVGMPTVSAMLSRIRQRYTDDRREMAVILGDARVRHCNGGGRASRWGYVRGDALRIIGGRYAGRNATYVGASNTDQVRVQIGGGVFAIRARFCQPMEKAA
jgi:DNA-binding CsgD family transcriptional regulator